MRGGGDESKYAAVFNQVCSSVKEEITTLQAETDTIYNEIEQLTAEQERIIADTPDREQYQREQTEAQEELQTVQNDIQQARDQIGGIEREAEGLLFNIDELDIQLGQLNQELQEVEVTVNEQPLTIAEMQFMQEQQRQELEAKENAEKEAQHVEDQIWKAMTEQKDLEKQLAEVCAELNEYLDHANLVHNFRCDAEEGAYYLKDKRNRMMDTSMNDMDIHERLDFDTEIKPLIEEKQQSRLSKV